MIIPHCHSRSRVSPSIHTDGQKISVFRIQSLSVVGSVAMSRMSGIHWMRSTIALWIGLDFAAEAWSSLGQSRARFLSSTAAAFLSSAAVGAVEQCQAASWIQQVMDQTAAAINSGTDDSFVNSFTNNPRYLDQELQMKFGDGPGRSCSANGARRRDDNRDLFLPCFAVRFLLPYIRLSIQTAILGHGVCWCGGLRETRLLSNFPSAKSRSSRNGPKHPPLVRKISFEPIPMMMDGFIRYVVAVVDTACVCAEMETVGNGGEGGGEEPKNDGTRRTV